MAEDLNALLNGFLDGRLSKAQASRLRARLERPEVARRLRRLEALRLNLRASAPGLSPEQSRLLWAKVRARCVEAAPDRAHSLGQTLAARPLRAQTPETGSWFGWLGRPWVPAWGLGLAAAAMALAFLLHVPSLRPQLAPAVRPPAVVPSFAAPAPPSLPAGRSAAVPAYAEDAPGRPHRKISPPAEALASAPPRPSGAGAPVQAAVEAVPVLAGLPVGSPAALGPAATEVERALADNQANALISQYLTTKPQEEAPVVAMLSPTLPASGAGDAATVAYQPSAAPLLQEESGSGVAGAVRGGKDGNGYWDWTPAAQAMNQRDWPQARVELLAAADKAGSLAERSFAHSALGLLSASGEPLEGVQPLLPAVGDLRVLGAGTWQLLVDSRLARFGKGVAVRLPGLREDGDSFLLDLGFNRGEFSPGSHFVRVSGEAPARVQDASGQPVSQDDFYAPSGADYDLQAKVLRLR